MNHSDSLPVKEEVPADRKKRQEQSQFKQQDDDDDVNFNQDLEGQDMVKDPKKMNKQKYQAVELQDNQKNPQLLVRKRRRIDPNGGQRPNFCFYEDYDQEFLQDISSHTLKQVKDKNHTTNDFYYTETEQSGGYHYFGYYYGPICPCFQMCEWCKELVSKNTERLGMVSGGGSGDSMCCYGLFDRADTCCKMMVDAWFYLICLPFRILVETYKSIFRVCCGGESISSSVSQATCFDQCCMQVYQAFSACWQCFSQSCTQICQPCCNAMNSCLGTACMQTVMEIGGVAFKHIIQFISIPLQGVILLCTQLCQRVIVPCCECLVRNGDICCEIFRCLG